MARKLVNFKGNKEGISIYVKDGNFEAIKKELDDKVKRSRGFFRGAKVIGIYGVDGKELTIEEEEELKSIIKEKYNMIIDNKKEQVEKVNQNNVNQNIIEAIEEITDSQPFPGIKEGITKFIKTTIRSGQLIEFDGNVVVLGDVNPGGVVTAKGNIIVLGSLRGVANAGSDGNEDSIVAAFSLQPTQLRIANTIARKPDGEMRPPKWPEIAKICEKSVVIEPYLLKK